MPVAFPRAPLGGAAADAAVTAALLAAGVVSVITGIGPDRTAATRPVDATYLPFLACIVLPLLWRRRHPFAVWLTVDVAALLAYGVFRFPVGLEVAAFPVALYGVAAHGRRVHVAVAAAVSLLQAAVTLGVYLADYYAQAVVTPGNLAATFGLVVAPVLVGLDVRRRRREAAALRDANARLERLTVLEAEQAAGAERARIARDLHDVVAHHLSGIVVQAGAGRRVFDSAPQEARAALERIQSGGSRALAEMRRLVGLLRDGDDALAPQPRIGEIAVLVDDAVKHGLMADLVVHGEPRPLPDAVEVSAYRIVQEALTNARRHASAASARVVVRYGPADVWVEVSNDGPPVNGRRGGGNGLTGMVERAELCGGRVEAGPRPEGGWRVAATLPAR